MGPELDFPPKCHRFVSLTLGSTTEMACNVSSVDGERQDHTAQFTLNVYELLKFQS